MNYNYLFIQIWFVNMVCLGVNVYSHKNILLTIACAISYAVVYRYLYISACELSCGDNYYALIIAYLCCKGLSVYCSNSSFSLPISIHIDLSTGALSVHIIHGIISHYN